MDLRERPESTTRHPWEVSRARFFRRLIAAHVAQPPVAVLDVGSGDNWFVNELLAELPTTTHVDCWDAHYTPADLTEPVNPRLRRMNSPPAQHYPLVLALDVLEHVENDSAFLNGSVVPQILPGGLLIVSVPAHPWLYTSHDEALGHFRRHTRASLRALLQPNLTIVQEGSLFGSLVPPRAAQRLVQQLRPRATGVEEINSGWIHGRLVTAAVTGVLDADARLGMAAARRRIPFPGLSLWAVCRVSSND